jgi:lysozyme
MDKQLLIDELKRDEGTRLLLYLDTIQKWTIGTGRNLSDRGISMAESDFMLANDINLVMSDLNKNLPWWINLTESRQRVLANMVFNLGIGKLLGFNNTLAYMKAGDYDKAADNMLKSVWAKQVGVRADRLAKMMREG